MIKIKLPEEGFDEALRFASKNPDLQRFEESPASYIAIAASEAISEVAHKLPERYRLTIEKSEGGIRFVYEPEQSEAGFTIGLRAVDGDV